MNSAEYRKLTDAQKYTHWKRYVPNGPEMAKVRRQAMRQFKAATREAK